MKNDPLKAEDFGGFFRGHIVLFCGIVIKVM